MSGGRSAREKNRSILASNHSPMSRENEIACSCHSVPSSGTNRFLIFAGCKCVCFALEYNLVFQVVWHLVFSVGFMMR